MNADATLAAPVSAPEPAFELWPSTVPGRARNLLSRTSVRVCLISVLVLVPCFWQTRIQAGDLSSHLYNAWLSMLIAEGKAPGLAITPQGTNVLFDLILSGLIRTVGPWGAEHIAVPVLVLNFFWGAFAMVCAVARRRPWYVLTFLGMLAYGWVFHMGFMNFYLAAGLSFWAFALLWEPDVKSTLCAVPLLALACLAHAVPVAWVVGASLYARVARKIPAANRVLLTFAAVAGIVAVRVFLMTHFPSRWLLGQVFDMTGADQLSVFGAKYYPLAFMLLAVWLSLFLRLTDAIGEGLPTLDIPFQICLVTSVAVLLIPAAVRLPGYNHALAFINDRMSLMVAVMACVLLGHALPSNRDKTAIAILMGLFFSFVYVDTRSLNYIEDFTAASISRLPENSRVISALCDLQTGVNPLAHIVDRACIGHCFSVANYEPSTAQFRIRALPGNSIVASDYSDSEALQDGTYLLKATDEPMYQIYLRGRYLDTRLLKPGDVTGKTCFEATPRPRDLLRERPHASQ
jgi:hypothetical protein